MMAKATLTRTLTKGMGLRDGDAYYRFVSEDNLLAWIDDQMDKHFQDHRTGKLKRSVRLTLTLEGLDGNNKRKNKTD